MLPQPDPQRALRLNERRQARAMADLGDEHSSLGAGVLAFMQGTPWMCKAVAVDLDEPLGDSEVSRIVEYYRARGVPPVVEITAYSHPRTLEALAAAGFHLVDVEHVLTRLPGDVDAPLPAGIRIQALDAEDAASLRRHAEIVCSGFPPPDGHTPEPLLEAAERSQRHPCARGYFACLEDGEPVAACGMEVSTVDPGDGTPAARVLALWGTTVLPRFRRRGIQQALIAHRLQVGAQEGCEVALIESRPGIPTERNAARLGFRLGYVRLVFRA